MRCFSLNWLKFILFETSFLQLGTGAFTIYAGVLFLNSPLVEAIELEWVGACIIAIGIFMIIFAVFVAFGTYYQNRWCLYSYMFVAGLSGVLLCVVGIACLWGASYAQSYLGSDKNCYGMKGLRDASESVIKAGSIMCTIFCPCDLKPTTQVQLYANQTFTYGTAKRLQDCNTCWHIQYYPAEAQALLIAFMKKFLEIDVTVDDCVIPDDAFPVTYMAEYAKYLDLLKYVEKRFDCSGICIEENVFLFTDINKGTPTGNCRKQIYDWIGYISLKFGVTNILFGCFQIFGLVIAFMMKRKQKIVEGIESPTTGIGGDENGNKEKEQLEPKEEAADEVYPLPESKLNNNESNEWL